MKETGHVYGYKRGNNWQYDNYQYDLFDSSDSTVSS